MAKLTQWLKLLKKDPQTDGYNTFNIETMLNENWDKVDAKIGDIGTPAQAHGLQETASIGEVLETFGDVAFSKCQIESGSYVGTGVFGPQNPNSITFGFVPKLVVVIDSDYSQIGDDRFAFVWAGQPGYLYYNSGVMSSKKFDLDDHTLSWYIADRPENSARWQQNEAGERYYYIGIG